MKKLAIITSLLIVISCNSKEEKLNEIEVKTFQETNFDYLIGEWIRINEIEGNSTFENWEKLNDFTYLGHGFTMKGKDTVWQERVVLSPVQNIWYFQVKSPSDSISTDFRIIEQTDSSFICENPQNEFPKTIKYLKKGKNLYAEISDGENTIPFEFSKKQ